MNRYSFDSARKFYNGVMNGMIEPFCDACMAEMVEHTSNISILGN